MDDAPDTGPPLTELPENPLATSARQLTDLGNAERFATYASSRARYCPQWGKWLIWNGQRWAIDDALTTLTLAKHAAVGIFAEITPDVHPEKQKAIAKWALKSQSRERLSAMVDLARPILVVNRERLDTQPLYLNCENGTIDLATGELLHHDADHLITQLAPVEYDANAKCPLWLAFLDRVMAGNVALIDYLQRLAGLCATADISEQHLYLFHGMGNNGKSVFLDTLAGVLGSYAATAPPDLLMQKITPDHPTEIADLCGRRMVIASETDEGRQLRVQLVKRVTGDKRLKARYMRGDFFEFPRTHKLILATNNRPVIRETTLAIWRRIKLVPFEVTIPPEEIDPNLIAKLECERSGILAWVVRGCLAWQREGLSEPSEVLAATANYREEQDPLADWLDECCTFDPNAMTTTKHVAESYTKWAENSKVKFPMSKLTLLEKLRTRDGLEHSQRRVGGKVEWVIAGLGVETANLYQ